MNPSSVCVELNQYFCNIGYEIDHLINLQLEQLHIPFKESQYHIQFILNPLMMKELWIS